MDGWMDGWMDGSKYWFKELLNAGFVIYIKEKNKNKFRNDNSSHGTAIFFFSGNNITTFLFIVFNNNLNLG
jgi:hypothetical protein